MYFTHENITMYYEKYGNNKKTIIILPGWGETRTTFNCMIDFLKDYFTIYILDYPGFGNSPFQESDLTIYDYTEAIYQWILSVADHNAILIGHSFGGRIITLLTGYYHYSFSNIILIDSAGIKPKKTLKTKLRVLSYKILKKLINLLPKKLKSKYQKKLFKHFASSDYQNLNPKMMQTFKNIVNEDLKPYLKYIKAKTLLIWGSMDEATPIKDAYTMNKLIRKSELIVLEGANHFPYLQRQKLINYIIFDKLKDEI